MAMHDQAARTAPLILSYSCSQKWELMAGDESVRNCAQCACKVENISDYTSLVQLAYPSICTHLRRNLLVIETKRSTKSRRLSYAWHRTLAYRK